MAIFAISTDDPATSDQVVAKFMADHKYTIPVLRGQDYSKAVGVQGIPTTLFIDPQGNLAFRKVGFSHHLVQEFDWRLQAMASTPAPAQASPKQQVAAKANK